VVAFRSVKVRWVLDGDRLPFISPSLLHLLGSLALVLREAKDGRPVLRSIIFRCMPCKEHGKEIRIGHFSWIESDSYRLCIIFYVPISRIRVFARITRPTVTHNSIENAPCAIKFTLRAPKSSHGKFGILIHIFHRSQERTFFCFRHLWISFSRRREKFSYVR